MIHLTAPPCRLLAPFIEHYWFLSDAPLHSRERIIPSGTVELVVNLVEDEVRTYDASRLELCRSLPGAVVSGAYRRPFVVDTREHASMVGVHFRPGGASRVFGVPASELADDHVPLELLWGSAAGELRERLCSERAPARRFRILEEALLRRWVEPGRRDRALELAVARLERGEPGLEVREVAREAGLSHRRFIDAFRREVGMTPKLFSRVRRFQRAQVLVKRGRAAAAGVDWAELAVEAGYFDQSHLIRDFTELSGLSPARFLAGLGAKTRENHLTVDPEGRKFHPIR